MYPLTREDITRTLGDVDDATIAEVMASGASVADLARAVRVVRDGEPLPEVASDDTRRVLDLCEVIGPLVEPDPEESGEYPATD